MNESIHYVKSIKSQLEGNHPKAAEFVKRVILTGLPEGTIVEVSITKPGEETKNYQMLK